MRLERRIWAILSSSRPFIKSNISLSLEKIICGPTSYSMPLVSKVRHRPPARSSFSRILISAISSRFCRKQAKEMADRPPPRIVSFMSLSFLQMGMKLNSLIIVLCCLRVILYNGRIPPSKAREDKDCSFILTRGKMPQSFIQRTFSISF